MLSDFKKILSARFFFTFAVQMQAVVLGWRMYDLTHDPLYLGLIGLSEAVPALGLALYAGYIVDRSRPLYVYHRIMEASFVSSLVMLVSQLPQVGLAQNEQVTALFVASFITGVARGFAGPVIFASVPKLVPRAEYGKASAWMATAMQSARISGPAIGGFIFGWMGPTVASVVVCLGIIVAWISAQLIRTKIKPATQSQTGVSVKEELLSGLKFVFRHPILLPALSLDMVAVLFGGVTALLPVFAAEVLMVGPKGLGVLRAAPAVGATIMSLWLTRNRIREGAGKWLFTSVAGFGLSILVFGLSQNFYLSMIALAISGAFDSVSMVIRHAAVQFVSPEHMRGRISAVNSIFIGSSNELGEFESGLAAKWLGAVPAVLVGGVICLLTVATVAFISPTLRRLDLGKLEDDAVTG